LKRYKQNGTTVAQNSGDIFKFVKVIDIERSRQLFSLVCACEYGIRLDHFPNSAPGVVPYKVYRISLKW